MIRWDSTIVFLLTRRLNLSSLLNFNSVFLISNCNFLYIFECSKRLIYSIEFSLNDLNFVNFKVGNEYANF